MYVNAVTLTRAKLLNFAAEIPLTFLWLLGYIASLFVDKDNVIIML